ncbi:hypothetical protein A3B40_00850 [Candidatus Roizmanbacteria bacterium RIFCSPLOWO2_01_FULL_37_16]|uniref:Uncharacterized protein n=1 Tax=Candidatus Roizmanbacteria bacterium RIFCSPLOWO2_01_FULL_37_16 TaxID=1802058 RepID=A0A1F7IKG1_9BACT|nr:MAG: hypothetical protein A3B40_00850 [Candidatus Roizmanbacteria bacterium RIFCSPLOWO2_01_FULL_37_16]
MELRLWQQALGPTETSMATNILRSLVTEGKIMFLPDGLANKAELPRAVEFIKRNVRTGVERKRY